jgi:nuclease S1
MRRSRHLVFLVVVVAFAAGLRSAQAWGVQGHRLVARVAANHLTPAARQNVTWLLAPESLADVASWADEYLVGVQQTAPWHYVNIPPAAAAYDRDRDCPRQPGVAVGARADAWRDCVVDRIRYNEERLADTTLDRADRAIALKFLVHFVGDVHQPLHASAIERGGNGILVRVFGSDTCGGDPARQSPCNLHGVWDTQLIAHRALTDRAFLRALEQRVAAERLMARPAGTPAEWAIESLKLSNAVMLPQKGDVDDAYYRKHIVTIEQRLALGGTRLAQLLNRALAAPPPRGR